MRFFFLCLLVVVSRVVVEPRVVLLGLLGNHPPLVRRPLTRRLFTVRFAGFITL